MNANLRKSATAEPETFEQLPRAGERLGGPRFKLISRRLHGVMDYIFGILLAASPWIFGFASEPRDTRIAVTLGCATLMYSLLTNYEVGVIRLFPFPVHLGFDVLLAILLLAGWVHFASVNRAGVVFAAFGIIAVVVLFLTKRPSRNERSGLI